uniref:Interleukin 1 receptor like 1 n=1 Tax=Amazona collaria TaxID=241587 RepID=A0A8B9FLA5_9PSIT
MTGLLIQECQVPLCSMWLGFSSFQIFIFCSFAVDAMEGEALVIKCPRWSSSVKATWYHTDTNERIPAEEDGSRIFCLERFLWFLPTSREDSGNYTCVIQFRIRYPNDTGRGKIVCPTIDNYKSATIIQWYKVNKTLTVPVVDQITMRSYLQPNTEIFIFQDCKPLHGLRYFKGEKYIFIKDPRKEDDGYYTCRFSYTHKGKMFNVSATRIFISGGKAAEAPAHRLSSLLILTRFFFFAVDLPSVLLIIGSLVLLVAIAVSVILYQSFRVDIVLLYREIFQLLFCLTDGKIYDAYVIFPKTHTNEANFVEYFVYHIMPDILENKCGYKLCIYGRDIYPGEAHAIEKTIQKSRRLIILLTRQLINCEEHAYDQHLALYNALILNDTKVILLEMETIGTYEKLQESLKFIIRQQGTVKWKEQHTVHPQSSNSKFWKQVRYHMPLIFKEYPEMQRSESNFIPLQGEYEQNVF